MACDLECDLEQIYFKKILNRDTLCVFVVNFIKIAEETTKIENWVKHGWLFVTVYDVNLWLTSPKRGEAQKNPIGLLFDKKWTAYTEEFFNFAVLTGFSKTRRFWMLWPWPLTGVDETMMPLNLQPCTIYPINMNTMNKKLYEIEMITNKQTNEMSLREW